MPEFFDRGPMEIRKEEIDRQLELEGIPDLKLSQHDINNFQTILAAARNDDLCIVSCTDKHTGKPVTVLCATAHKDGMIDLVPMARFFDSNPYECLIPPEIPDIVTAPKESNE